MGRRFKSLRDYGRLPRGRENREKILTNQEIAASLLGIATTAPGWAGISSIILSNLMPVGGSESAFASKGSLIAAIVVILENEEFRDRLISVSMSVAEGGVNSNGFATLVYDDGEYRKRTNYVSPQAVSFHGRGADKTFDAEHRYAMIGREISFSSQFIHRLVREVKLRRSYPLPVTGDGSEYDAEEVEEARQRRLGATKSSNFLNIGVDNQVTWPKEETLISFDQYQIVLMPKTSQNVQSIHIDMHKNQLSTEEALTIINRFLSVMTWCDDQFAIAQGGWSGGHVPVPVRKRDLAFTTTHHWLFDRHIPESADQRKALAFYREARNAQQNYMVSYAVLNFYKVIEIRYPGQKEARKWIAENLDEALYEFHDNYGVQDFLDACGEEDPDLYIYAACRVAVAHSSPNRISDPDDANELRRLHNAADVMRRLARLFIRKELKISDRPW